MALYTWTGNKSKNDHTSRITLSASKDIVIGETVDLTSPELALVQKTGANVVAGTVATTINSLTFGAGRVYYRAADGVATVIRTIKLK